MDAAPVDLVEGQLAYAGHSVVESAPATVAWHLVHSIEVAESAVVALIDQSKQAHVDPAAVASISHNPVHLLSKDAFPIGAWAVPVQYWVCDFAFVLGCRMHSSLERFHLLSSEEEDEDESSHCLGPHE